MRIFYRRLLVARRGSPALRLGSFEETPAPEGVLAFRRVQGDDVRVVAVNFTERAVEIRLSGAVEVASDGAGEGETFTGRLEADQAVVLRVR